MHTFTLPDADGVLHTYETNRHRTELGAPLTAWVTGHVIETLARHTIIIYLAPDETMLSTLITRRAHGSSTIPSSTVSVKTS